MEWILWVEQNALVLNPAFTFPYSRYNAAGHSIIMYGNPETTWAGHVNGAFAHAPPRKRQLLHALPYTAW